MTEELVKLLTPPPGTVYKKRKPQKKVPTIQELVDNRRQQSKKEHYQKYLDQARKTTNAEIAKMKPRKYYESSKLTPETRYQKASEQFSIDKITKAQFKKLNPAYINLTEDDFNKEYNQYFYKYCDWLENDKPTEDTLNSIGDEYIIQNAKKHNEPIPLSVQERINAKNAPTLRNNPIEEEEDNLEFAQDEYRRAKRAIQEALEEKNDAKRRIKRMEMKRAEKERQKQEEEKKNNKNKKNNKKK